MEILRNITVPGALQATNPRVYLDWNVFNKIEKKSGLELYERSLYSDIEELIIAGKIVAPYSNAHINDLLRGYRKNKEFTPLHIQTLKRLTSDLCIVQYWGQNKVTWHYRDVKDFFDSSLEDLSFTHKKFTELVDWQGIESAIMEIRYAQLRTTPLPANFGEIYKAHPIFGMMFPKSRIEPNMLSLCEDIFDFSQNALKDYSIYKSLRTYLNQERAKLKNHAVTFRNIDKSMTDVPKHLTFDEAWHQIAPRSTSDNSAYQKVTDLYYKTDLSGYRSDEKMANLIDDSIHVFYGSQCDYFVTIDQRCFDKAVKIFNDLKIRSRVLKPETLLNELRS